MVAIRWNMKVVLMVRRQYNTKSTRAQSREKNRERCLRYHPCLEYCCYKIKLAQKHTGLNVVRLDLFSMNQ